MKRLRVILVAAVALAVAGWWLLPESAPTHAAAGDGTEAQSRAAKERVALARDVANLRSQVSVLRGEAMRADTAASGADDANDEPVADAVVESLPPPSAEEMEHRHRAALRAQVDSGGRDSTWSPRAEEELGAAVAAAAPRATRDVRCSADICLVRVRWPDERDRDDTVDNMLDLAPWQWRGAMYVDPDDPLTADIFVSREGAAWPAL